MTTLPTRIAKEELERLNDALKEPHLLIGGLAVQQYHPPRNSQDIDLVCDDSTARSLLDELYPTNLYSIEEQNGDDFRPSYVIKDRKKEKRVILIGPKITERSPYKFIDWNLLRDGAVAFKHQNKELPNILVPKLESLAFTKLLSFLSRTPLSKEKGEQDLRDFINLTNNKNFGLQSFIDHVSHTGCAHYLSTQIEAIKDSYDNKIWLRSSFCDLIHMLRSLVPLIDDGVARRMYKAVYQTDTALPFYDRIARKYDSRNTDTLYRTHQKTIGYIRARLGDSGKILDLGCGTGKIIAAHFVHRPSFSWTAVDGSEAMLSEFTKNTRDNKMVTKNVAADLRKMDWNAVAGADMCIMSFILSSLDSWEWVPNAIERVKRGGCILVADAHPSYAKTKPHYDFEENEDKIALMPRHVYPDKLAEVFLHQGCSLYNQETIFNDFGQDYAFISIYEKNRD